MSEHRDDHAAPLAEPRDNASVVPSASSFSPSPLSNDTPVNGTCGVFQDNSVDSVVLISFVGHR